MRRTAPLVPKCLSLHRTSASSNSRLHQISYRCPVQAAQLPTSQRLRECPLDPVASRLPCASWGGTYLWPGSRASASSDCCLARFRASGRRSFFSSLLGGGSDEATGPWAPGGRTCLRPVSGHEGPGHRTKEPRPGARAHPALTAPRLSQLSVCPSVSALSRSLRGEALMCRPGSGLGTPCSARFRASDQGNLLSSLPAPDPVGGGTEAMRPQIFGSSGADLSCSAPLTVRRAASALESRS
ncbi:hypothetical protein NDU88_001859 [Pleurodeles waltl]|uniref:Uncharacterized protein n=1 Tax=Pleurodeles waltl TaxID=8319 RepID=A0AAV7MPX5_PLEWA|nr:hypothetical protein NDU88_001859 [Pleurodeles waltl]